MQLSADEIVDYCFKPRTMNELTARFNASKNAIGPRLRKLMTEQRIIRRVTDQGTENMMHWYMMIETPKDPSTLSKRYSKQVMGVWL